MSKPNWTKYSRIIVEGPPGCLAPIVADYLCRLYKDSGVAYVDPFNDYPQGIWPGECGNPSHAIERSCVRQLAETRNYGNKIIIVNSVLFIGARIPYDPDIISCLHSKYVDQKDLWVGLWAEDFDAQVFAARKIYPEISTYDIRRLTDRYRTHYKEWLSPTHVVPVRLPLKAAQAILNIWRTECAESSS